MVARPASADTGLGVSFICSAVIHLAVFLLVVWLGRQAPENMHLQETYYVDVVNLPVAEPRAGSPTQQGNDNEQVPPPPLRTPESPMALPPPNPAAAAKGAKTTDKAKEAASEASSFAERMAKLEGKAEARHEESALAGLQKRVKSPGSGRSGMPAGSGKESGSDYTAYIQSRLKDAFRETISYSSKNPEMVVRLFIDTDGKLSRIKPERSSGDQAFEIAVRRAIELASERFTPPPNHKVFDGVFVFRPEGISQKNR
jgi:colicin import membrane protein